MRRIIVTGANGAGKSHLAERLRALRPEVPVVSIDAMKLTTGWQRRPHAEVEAALTAAVREEAWILEGGPSLLPMVVSRAEGVIWLDPPRHRRALRLLIRPWRHFGQTRPELPKGNPDWPWRQYLFALNSLRKDQKFRDHVLRGLKQASDIPQWHCRTQGDIDAAVERWGAEL